MCDAWDGNAYLYAAIIPGTCCAMMFYAFWHKKINRDCSWEEYKRWCRYWCGKVMEPVWNCLMVYTTAH